MTITRDAVEQGLRAARWPARMQAISRQPLVVADGAHNGESAERLAVALREWFPGRQWTLVFGASSDKDFTAMLDALLPVSSRAIMTRARSVRAADLERLADLAASRGARVEAAPSVGDALEAALHGLDDYGGVIVTGSLFVAAEAEQAWAARVGAPLPDTDD